MIGISIPTVVSAMPQPHFGTPLGRAGYYGPPFQDRSLQRTYIDESNKLASESYAITKGTARKLVAAVINSALAAGEAAIPMIEARVRREAKKAAKGGVGELFLGGIAVVALGLSVWGVMRAGKR